jgi:hypothetical protein
MATNAALWVIFASMITLVYCGCRFTVPTKSK